jgi:DNA-binding MarR family transcriptional regulator
MGNPSVSNAVDSMGINVYRKLQKLINTSKNSSNTLKSKIGLGIPELLLLRAVNEVTETTVGNLSKSLSLNISTTSNLLSKLETDGYVARNKDKNDKRTIIVKLMPKGKRLVSKAPSKLNSLQFAFMALSTEELEIFESTIEVLTKLLG